jgi:hypothetical protein
MQWIPAALSPQVKLQEREADHSPPSSAEFKYLSSSIHIRLHGMLLNQLSTGTAKSHISAISLLGINCQIFTSED